MNGAQGGGMDALFYAFGVLLFAAVIFGVEGAYLWWSGVHGGAAKRIARRLDLMSGGAGTATERVSILKQRRMASHPALDRLLQRQRARSRSTACWCRPACAGAWPRSARWRSAAPCWRCWCCNCGPCRRWRKASPRCWPPAPRWRCCGARARYACARSKSNCPRSPTSSRALRAGHAFTNVLQMVGAEMPEPLAGEFRAAHEEINYGVPMNEALHNLAARIPLTDLRYLVIAVVIQRESGGNLAEILGNISHIIRERLKLLAQVRVLSAEGRMSAWILGLLPFAVIVIMMFANPAYITVLWTDPIGIRMLWYGAGMLLLGVVWLRRLIHIRV